MRKKKKREREGERKKRDSYKRKGRERMSVYDLMYNNQIFMNSRGNISKSHKRGCWPNSGETGSEETGEESTIGTDEVKDVENNITWELRPNKGGNRTKDIKKR